MHWLSESTMDPNQDQILDTLATKVAEKLMENDQFIEKVGQAGGQAALDRFHKFVGQSVIDRLIWIVGAAALGAWAYFNRNGNP